MKTLMETRMDEQIEQLLTIMKNDYRDWSSRGSDPHGVRDQMYEE